MKMTKLDWVLLVVALALAVWFGLALSAKGQNVIGYGHLQYANVGAGVASGTTFYPTNVGTPVAWWRADTYYTNSGAATVLDELSKGWNLTESTIDAGTPTTNVLDGQKYLHFNGGDGSHLAASAFEIPQPAEAALLIRPHAKATGSSQIIRWASPADLVDFIYYQYADGTVELMASATTTIEGSATLSTNQWYLFDVIFDGVNSRIYTNNALYLAGDTGTYGLTNINVAARSAYLGQTPCDIAQIIVYSATNTTADRGKVYNFFKTNYPSASLP